MIIRHLRSEDAVKVLLYSKTLRRIADSLKKAGSISTEELALLKRVDALGLSKRLHASIFDRLVAKRTEEQLSRASLT